MTRPKPPPERFSLGLIVWSFSPVCIAQTMIRESAPLEMSTSREREDSEEARKLVVAIALTKSVWPLL